MSRSLLGNNQKKPRNRGFTIVGLIVLMAIYIATLIVVQRSRLAFGAVSLQAITALNITLILVMLFVLGRNIIKLYVERRRKKLGSQFRMRVVVTYIGMALIPTVLLFIVASGLIRTAVESWFSTDTEQIVRRAREVSEQSQEGQARELQRVADMISDEIRRGNIGTADSDSREFLRARVLIPRSRQAELEAILVYEGSELLLNPYFDPDGKYATFFQEPTISSTPSAVSEETNGGPTRAIEPLPETHPLYVPPAQIAMALQQQPFRLIDDLAEGVRLLRAGVPIYHPSSRNEVTGVLIVARVVSDELVAEVSAIEGLYDSFMSGLAEKGPILSNYLLTFLLITLLIIFSALWVGLYLARGVTVPIQKLAEGTRAVASGDLSYQVEVEAQDELGTLVESFNQMTLDLRAGQKNLRQSRDSLQATNTELDERRRYMEAMLANISTGVISLNAEGEISTFNRAAERILAIEASAAIGRPSENVLSGDSFSDLSSLMARATARRAPLEHELSLDVKGNRLTVAAHCSSLRDSAGAYIGTVVVLDNLTELITAQKRAAWREVARRIAHEIRNPLTPIQLSAQRIARRYQRAAGAEGQFNVIEEGTQTILQEVDTLKGLVSEFSRYARMPPASLVSANLHEIIENGLLACASMHEGITVDRNFAEQIPTINADLDQLKRVFTNLFDNAIAAMEGEGTLRVSTSYDHDLQTTRIEVADTGSGIKPEDKDRLFLPYFSRKRGGTGLGLAIVHQIVADHSGYVRVSDNHPRGTVMTIELPC